MDKKRIYIDLKRYLNYFKGETHPSERHQFEQEMMQDAFDMEAYDGITKVGGQRFEKDMQELLGQLPQKKRGVVIPMRRSFAAAAMIIVLLGTGLLVYHLLDFAQHDKGMAIESKVVHEDKSPPIITNEKNEVESNNNGIQKEQSSSIKSKLDEPEIIPETTERAFQEDFSIDVPKESIIQESESVLAEEEPVISAYSISKENNVSQGSGVATEGLSRNQVYEQTEGTKKSKASRSARTAPSATMPSSTPVPKGANENMLDISAEDSEREEKVVAMPSNYPSLQNFVNLNFHCDTLNLICNGKFYLFNVIVNQDGEVFVQDVLSTTPPWYLEEFTKVFKLYPGWIRDNVSRQVKVQLIAK